MISSLGCHISRRCWGSVWGWSQWGRARCFILYRWGRCVPRQYTSARHFRYWRWGNSQTQSAGPCVQKWHWLHSLEGETNQWRCKGHRRAGQCGEWLYGWEEKAQKSRLPWPPISYMEERRLFQPLNSTTNPLGLCHFYSADPNMSMPTTPKPLATVEHVKKLLFLASTQWWPYIIVVFQGGTVTPLGLLQELHTWSALVCIPIYLPGETKDGHKPCVSCCPFCVYTVQNNPAYLNHIVCMHYDANFACGTCLSAITSSGQQMKNHIKECSGLAPPPTASQENLPSGRSPKRVLLAPRNPASNPTRTLWRVTAFNAHIMLVLWINSCLIR